MSELIGANIHITGIVQGVGFRPFVYGLASRFNLTGWVRNTSAGVDIEVDGTSDNLGAFIATLKSETPPLARIDEFTVIQKSPNGYASFEIINSQPIIDAYQPISPDVSICPDCLRELFDPTNSRYHYPFINCTNCGPRYTIIEDIPYDRPNTTMSAFPMCPDCAAEYNDPSDRRFHAQPIACPVCGPQVWLEIKRRKNFLKGESAISEAQSMIASGKIVAIKGLGGFHLACDATNSMAVTELRRRKLRVDKPFALMMPDLETIETHCFIDKAICGLLQSRERPIVILKRRPESNITDKVAPGQDTIGVMLPYTPLHYLLLSSELSENNEQVKYKNKPVFVMTSGNLSEEPIATDNEEARQRLAALADALLMHDRPIRTRCDDSVVRIYYMPGISHNHTQIINTSTSVLPVRRARGYAPFPVRLPWDSIPLLATGTELKNTFCITHGRYAFLSHHIGDLENYETLRSYEDGILHFERLFRVHPEVLVYDLHPDYLATRYALDRSKQENLTAIGVQHHHAHIAACMAEHSLTDDQKVIGVAFDGTGYGDDKAIWGGEFLLADYHTYQRVGHLAYVPLPGGDAAIRDPWRIALSWLTQAGIDWEKDLPPVQYAIHSIQSVTQNLKVLRQQIQSGLNSPFTSSMGRLFDAIAALTGVRQKVNYEAQAAVELEALVDPNEINAYHFEIRDLHDPLSTPSHQYIIDPTPLIYSIVADLKKGVSVSVVSARFHNAVAEMVYVVVLAMRNLYGPLGIALSGGVWQNITLLTKTMKLLNMANIKVYIHSMVPPNDGGVSLGQAAIAAHHFPTGGK